MKRTFPTAFAALLAAGAFSTASAQEARSARMDVTPPAFDEADTYTPSVPTIPKGTEIPVTLDEDIPVQRDRIGDSFEGHIARDVKVDGEVLLVSGAPVTLKLVESPDQAGAATIELDEVHVNGDMRDVEADVARADTDEQGPSTAKKTGIGAAAGAVIGAVTGAGVLEGAVVGAGGGLAWGLLDGDQARQVDDDTTLRFSLERDLSVD